MARRSARPLCIRARTHARVRDGWCAHVHVTARARARALRCLRAAVLRSIARCCIDHRGASVLHPGTTLTAVMLEYTDSRLRIVVPRRMFDRGCKVLEVILPYPLGDLPPEVLQLCLRSCTAGTLLHLQATCHALLLGVRVLAHPSRWTRTPFTAPAQLTGAVVGLATAGGLLACAVERGDHSGHLAVFSQRARVYGVDVPSTVTAVAVHPDGDLLACVSAWRLRLYSMKRDVLLATKQLPGDDCTGMCFRRDALIVAIFRHLFHFSCADDLRLVKALETRVAALAGDGRRITVAWMDGRIDVRMYLTKWTKATDMHLQPMSSEIGTHVAIDGTTVAAATTHHHIKVWYCGARLPRMYTRIQHTQGVTALHLRGATLLAASEDAKLCVWDVDGDTVREAGVVLPGHAHPTGMVLHEGAVVTCSRVELHAGVVVTSGAPLNATQPPFVL